MRNVLGASVSQLQLSHTALALVMESVDRGWLHSLVQIHHAQGLGESYVCSMHAVTRGIIEAVKNTAAVFRLRWTVRTWFLLIFLEPQKRG